MWWVMMIAMMMPSAAAVVLIHAAVGRKQTGVKWPLVGTAVFIAGYLVVWAGFSLVATALQWSLENLGIVTGMTEIASPIIAALVLVAAGLYQMSPLKNACLSHCQHPMAFITQRWRPGGFGAFWMGLEHGAYCVGCCWFLMALLFVGGIMNLIFIAAIALYIGIEKLAAGQHWLRKFSGAGLTMAGLYVLGKQFMTT
jgi:predicted metal-binding membrane protein